MDPDTKFYLFHISYLCFFLTLYIVGARLMRAERNWKTILIRIGGFVMAASFAVILYTNIQYRQIQEDLSSDESQYNPYREYVLENRMKENRDLNKLVWRIENVGILIFSIGFVSFCANRNSHSKNSVELTNYNAHLETRIAELEQKSL